MKDLVSQRFWNFPTVSFPSVFDELESVFPTTVWPSTDILKGLTVSEDDKHVYIEAAVPGVDPKDVDVHFDRGTLTIRASKKEEEKRKTYHKKASHSFFYRVTPGDVDVNAAPDAMCKHGVMKVTFKKQAARKSGKVPVKEG